jgi:hypothetical protein
MAVLQRLFDASSACPYVARDMSHMLRVMQSLSRWVVALRVVVVHANVSTTAAASLVGPL